MQDEYRWLGRANKICKKFGILQGSGLAVDIVGAMQEAFEKGSAGKSLPQNHDEFESKLAKRQAGEEINHGFVWYCLCGASLQGVFLNIRDSKMQGQVYWRSHSGLGHGPTDRETAEAARKRIGKYR